MGYKLLRSIAISAKIARIVVKKEMPPNEPQPCSKHVLTTNVLDDLEKSRDTISKILADAEGLEKVRDIFNHIERLDISMIE